MSERIWLIWSNQQHAWWGPESLGYVGIIEMAGRYTRAEAEEICDRANRYLSKGKKNEVLVFSPEGMKRLEEIMAIT